MSFARRALFPLVLLSLSAPDPAMAAGAQAPARGTTAPATAPAPPPAPACAPLPEPVTAEAIDAAIEAAAAVLKATPREALPCYEQLTPLVERHGTTRQQALALDGLGRALGRRQRWPEAQPRYEQALARYRALQDGLGEARMLRGLAVTYYYAGTPAKARELLLQALPTFERLQDSAELLLTYDNLLYFTDEGPEKDALRERALAIARRSGDSNGRACGILHEWGDGLYAQGRYADALTRLTEALSCFDATTENDNAGLVLVSLGRLHRAHGRPDIALRYYKRALVQQEAARDEAAVVQTLNALAVTYDLLNEREEGARHFELALARATAMKSPQTLAFIQGQLGGHLLSGGETARAIPLLEQSLRLDPRHTMYRQGQLSQAYSIVGRHAEALEAGNAAVALARQSGASQLLPALRWRENVHYRAGRLVEAQADLEEAFAVLDALRRQTVATDFMKRGFTTVHQDLYGASVALLFQQGRTLDALEVAERARARAFLDLLATRQTADAALGRDTGTRLASAPAANATPVAASASLSSSGSAASPSPTAVPAAVSASASNSNSASAAASAALPATMTAPATAVASAQAPAGQAPAGQPPAEAEAIVAGRAAGDAPLAVTRGAAQRATGAAAVSSSTGSSSSASSAKKDAPAQSAAGTANPGGATAASTNTAAAKTGGANAASASATSANAGSAQTRTAKPGPAGAGTTRGVDGLLPHEIATADGTAAIASSEAADAPTLADMRATAARLRSTLLVYWVDRAATYIWTVAPSGQVHATRVPVTSARLEALVSEMARSVDSAAAGLGTTVARMHPWRELHRLLIEPVRRHLPATRDSLLTIVPHGPLFRVSFAALQDPQGRYLLERHRLHYTPSVGVLAFTAARATPPPAGPAGTRALLIGDPDPLPREPGDDVMPPLPWARREVEDIGTLAGTAKPDILTQRAARESAVRALIEQADLLHFATHGVVQQEESLSSFLALASTDAAPADAAGLTPAERAKDDGRLTAEEVYALNLRARLVVLSACRTALGPLGGDGVIGFTRAFLYAGAASVIATSWDVPDEAGYEVMRRFYRARAGEAMDDASGASKSGATAETPETMRSAAAATAPATAPMDESASGSPMGTGAGARAHTGGTVAAGRTAASVKAAIDTADALRDAQLGVLASLRRGTFKVSTVGGPVALKEHPLLWAGFLLVGEP